MKNKFMKIAAIIFFAGATLGFIAGAITENSLAKNKIVTEVYTVKQGDTFMEICAEYRKRDDRNPYIFEFMDEIRRLNPQLVENKNQIYPGDEIIFQYKVNEND